MGGEKNDYEFLKNPVYGRHWIDSMPRPINNKLQGSTNERIFLRLFT